MKISLTRPEPSKKGLGLSKRRQASQSTKKKNVKPATVKLLNPDHQEDHMDIISSDAVGQEVSQPNVCKLTVAQRKRLKKKRAKALWLAEKAKRPKREKEEPPLSSSIVLPSRPARFTPSLDTDEKKLSAARERLAEFYSHTLKIQPIPRPCPPGLLKDLCPLAINVRIPEKNGARYAFLQFRNPHELTLAQQQLSTQSLNGKPLRIALASSHPRDQIVDSHWRSPHERQSADFIWNMLCVSHLPRSTTRLDLGQVFRTAKAIRMPTLDDGSCKGTCFLTYKSPQAALFAFETRHRTYIRGSPVHVNFALRHKVKAVAPTDVTEKTGPPTSSHISSIVPEIPKPSSSPPQNLPPMEVPSEPVDFTIDRTAKIDPEKRKISPANHKTTNKQQPRITQNYQLKRKGTRTTNTTMSSLEQLLRMPASKPKNSKKSKRVTKRGKPSKHR